MKRIVLAICTYSRERAFQQCMETVCRLAHPEGVAFSLLIVENGAEDYARRVMAALECPFDWQVINAPQRGLVNVRNAAINGFLATDANWLGFVDDDEEVEPGWLQAMAAAIDRHHEARAFAGPTYEVLPEGADIWFERKYTPLAAGATTLHCGTGNILLNRVIFADDGLALRFDMRFNLSGGEDTMLFYEMERHGHLILWVPDAVCYEPVPPVRQRFGWRIAIKVRAYSNSGRFSILIDGALRGRILIIRRITHWFFSLVGHAALALVTLPFGRARSRENFVRAVASASAVLGYGHAFLGLRMRTYLGRATLEVEAEPNAPPPTDHPPAAPPGSHRHHR